MTIRERRFGVNPNEGAKEEAPFLLRNFGRTKSDNAEVKRATAIASE